ncbi:MULTISPECIES: Nif11-like leader peptide family natural product precursor [unclassified Prochlorococcus]|uniref:Nif11-like leader peptide family natural product precursor n=1 Tax=unclassified Prochlorococcus TaxID=2627481 RepID=UPI000533A013|nr:MULTISPECIES: Nif11-like leader peptide family natural product precursor [unclassified Prochlorococcus]KGG25279.1 putative SAP domain [Prochlorococcus sp. MIT 0701]KGG26311.1 putative SAP domain [Prochlorococcus sp. MIT 0702]KGG31274.1 putative SAP domain [Prochlorococcus sp. MIT 0703]
MSEEQLKAFLEKVKADTSLQEKLKAAADVDAVLAIAKEAGFSISADDLKNAQQELSEEELEGAAGGHPGGLSDSQRGLCCVLWAAPFTQIATGKPGVCGPPNGRPSRRLPGHHNSSEDLF